MNRVFPKVLTVALSLAVSLPVSAQEGNERALNDVPSNEGALFLLLPVGAKAVSLGRAMTAMEGTESAFWNPAGLAQVRQSQVVLFRGDNVTGTGTAVSTLFVKPGVGTIGASYYLHDVGSQDLTDGDRNFLGTFTVRNHLGVASAAANLFSGFSMGLNFKVIQFRTSCRGTFCPDVGTTATTYAIDAGVQGRLLEGLRVGAMLAHLGPRMQVLNAEQADPLPTRIRVGAAYNLVTSFTESQNFAGWVSVEVQDHLRDPSSLSLYVGTELVAGEADALFLRAGYVIGELDQEHGARVGLGLAYERFDLTIAKSLVVSTLTGDTEPVHVTFSVRF